MSQSIEFFLHPPSPRLNHSLPPRINTSQCTLPSVSSILGDSPCSASSLSSFNSTDLPTLCLPREHHTYLETVEPQTDTTSLPSLSPFMGSLSLDSPPQRTHLLPPPINSRRCRSLSNASTNSSSSFFSTLSNPERDTPLYVDTEEDEEEDSLSVEVLNTKRKRGRPPNSTRQATQRDSWTFVTPTVWDVKQHQEPVTVHHAQKEEYVLLHWPQIKEQLQQEGQNTFTSTKMDTTLSMPKKKRGRKPKTQMEGNSCFVWRDLTARRGVNKKKSTAK